jgi:hypothetical protein
MISKMIAAFDAACIPTKVFVCNKYCTKPGVYFRNYAMGYSVQDYSNDPYKHRTTEYFYTPYNHTRLDYGELLLINKEIFDEKRSG